MSIYSRLAFALVGSAVVASMAASTANAQAFVNGSFETPVVGTGITTLGVGSNAMTGWVIEAGSVDVVGSSLWPAFDGLNSVDLDGTAAGTISQTFSTLVGSQYTYSFEYSNNTGTGSLVTATATVVSASAQTLSTLNFSHQGASGASVAAMKYTLGTGFFTATSTTSTLRFTSTDSAGSNQGIVLDAASVVQSGTGAAPEPVSSALLAVGLPMGLALLRRRVRRS